MQQGQKPAEEWHDPHEPYRFPHLIHVGEKMPLKNQAQALPGPLAEVEPYFCRHVLRDVQVIELRTLLQGWRHHQTIRAPVQGIHTPFPPESGPVVHV